MLTLHGRLRCSQGVRPGLLIPLGILDGVEPAALELLRGAELGVAAEHDVRASASHVGGDRHCSLAARLGDDRGLALVVLGIEDLVAHATLLELL